MAKAAGIILIAFGAMLLGVYIPYLIISGHGPYMFFIGLFFVGPAVFIVSGGALCLWTEYWKVCFSSALLMVVIMAVWLLTGLFSARWVGGLLTSVSILPIIFICLRKSEWL
jgi:hypothetical protein